MNLARIGNKYLADTEPWKLIKTDPERVKTIMNLSLQIAANLAIAFEPFLPFSAEKLRGFLNINEFNWENLGKIDLIEDGHKINEATLLFEKIEDEVVDAQIQKLMDTKKQNEISNWKPAEMKAETTYEDFTKMDIRVGTVLECQKVPKADKLLQFKIDDGMGGRTIVSGIAKYYNPEDLIGKQVCFIANFPTRKLKGVESQGMILSAVNADGSLCVVSPSKQTINGATVE
jgi:methionyl-tRNA synthetase